MALHLQPKPASARPSRPRPLARAVAAVAAVEFLPMLLVMSCSGDPAPFQPAEVSPPPNSGASLVTYIRPERDAGFAWRVYAREGDFVWAAATADGMRIPMFEVGVRRLDANGEPLNTWSRPYGIEPGTSLPAPPRASASRPAPPQTGRSTCSGPWAARLTPAWRGWSGRRAKAQGLQRSRSTASSSWRFRRRGPM